MKLEKLQIFIRLITCVLMLMAVAVNRNGKILGYGGTSARDISDSVVERGNGILTVHTSSIGHDIIGYGGDVPLDIMIEDGRISSIVALKNAETPDFFETVKDSVFPQFIGLTPEEAVSADVDGVTGATLSSNAVVTTVRRGLGYVENVYAADAVSGKVSNSLSFYIALLVVLSGAFIPLFFKSYRFRIVQLIFNILVLGLWCGTFLSYSLMVNFVSNGAVVKTSILPMLLLAIAVIYPFFGKKSHYCMWLCPFGSVQELAGKCVRRKLRIPPHVMKMLYYLRDSLWAVLMLVMWCGVGFEWMGYELFSAFMFRQASIYVIAVSLLVILLSVFVSRPYCRFICPTGNLLRLFQNPNN